MSVCLGVGLGAEVGVGGGVRVSVGGGVDVGARVLGSPGAKGVCVFVCFQVRMCIGAVICIPRLCRLKGQQIYSTIHILHTHTYTHTHTHTYLHILTHARTHTHTHAERWWSRKSGRQQRKKGGFTWQHRKKRKWRKKTEVSLKVVHWLIFGNGSCSCC